MNMLWNLRDEADTLKSLSNFHPHYMSLTKPHPLWSTVGSNQHEVTKAIQQARFLSGIYRTEKLMSHWTSNQHGYCLSLTCNKTIETVKHILIECSVYEQTRVNFCRLWLSAEDPNVLLLVMGAMSSDTDYLLLFITDCSVLCTVIRASQRHGSTILDKLFYLTRTWCYAVHRRRMKNLGRWNFL